MLKIGDERIAHGWIWRFMGHFWVPIEPVQSSEQHRNAQNLH